MNPVTKEIKERWLNECDRDTRRSVWCFSNIFAFINFCKYNHLAPDNSITYYDEENNRMYIERVSSVN